MTIENLYQIFREAIPEIDIKKKCKRLTKDITIRQYFMNLCVFKYKKTNREIAAFLGLKITSVSTSLNTYITNSKEL